MNKDKNFALHVVAPLPTHQDRSPKPLAKGEPLPPELPVPESGRGFYDFDKAATTSFLWIKPEDGDLRHLVVKVYQEHKLVCWFFMRAGDSYKTAIPAGEYDLTIARGHKWYGERHIFRARRNL